MVAAADAVVDALAVARLTRLVTKDIVTAQFRDAVIAASYGDPGKRIPELSWSETVTLDDDPPKLATLITCPWCSSVYVAAGVFLARRFVPRVWAPVAASLAMSQVAGMIANVDV